ncbi:MAG: hypothetical protein V4710_18965 [Verrucomicrobiota bacterium]
MSTDKAPGKGISVRIEPLEAGSHRTLRSATVANQIINIVNALSGMTFSPEGIAKLDITPSGAIMTINIPAPPSPPEPVTYAPVTFWALVQTIVDGEADFNVELVTALRAPEAEE